MDKETSSRVSTIAGDYLNFDRADLDKIRSDFDAEQKLIDDIQSIAASALTQDETSGQSQPAGIHPAPAGFSDAQIATDPVLHYFHYAHLPSALQSTSRRFFTLAYFVVTNLPRNAERTVALRKLLEAKDAAVRANLPSPTFGQKQLPLASELKAGEAREVGGHDEDRDGPIPFNG